jgi:hypothetical protein
MRNMFDKKNKVRTSFGAWKGGFHSQIRYAGVYSRRRPPETSVLIMATE